ncbi:hypothetical protein D3C81_1741120 [compost metagenome]
MLLDLLSRLPPLAFFLSSIIGIAPSTGTSNNFSNSSVSFTVLSKYSIKNTIPTETNNPNIKAIAILISGLGDIGPLGNNASSTN